MIAKDTVAVSQTLAPVKIVVSSGPRGPAGAPGAGIQIKGVADSWPPAPAPAPGDLWVIPDPAPAGTPEGFAPGDGAAWDGQAWVNTGPIRGEAGPPGPPTVIVSTTPPPAPTFNGFLWVNPEE